MFTFCSQNARDFSREMNDLNDENVLILNK